MAIIYIEISEGLIQGVYTDSEYPIDIVVCDHDDEAEERNGDGFDFQATNSCNDLRDNIGKMRKIY